MYFSSVTEPGGRRDTPSPTGDGSTVCRSCGEQMREEHSHDRCPACGSRDSCCDGPY